MRELNYSFLHDTKITRMGWIDILIELWNAKERGEEVVAHIHKHTFYSKDFDFDKAMRILTRIKEIKVEPNEPWIKALYKLEEAKENGKEVFTCIKGEVFYSVDFDFEEACKKLIDYTESRNKEYALAHLRYWYNRGEKLVYPERMIEWRGMVNEQAIFSGNFGKNIDRVLELMEMLDQGCTVEEVKKAMSDMNLMSDNYKFLCKVILFFSKRGPEFVQVSPDHKDYDYYLDIISQNKEYEEAERKRKEEIPTGGVPGKK